MSTNHPAKKHQNKMCQKCPYLNNNYCIGTMMKVNYEICINYKQKIGYIRCDQALIWQGNVIPIIEDIKINVYHNV